VLVTFRTAGVVVLGLAFGLSCKRSLTTDRRHEVSPTSAKRASTEVSAARLRDGDLIFQESTSRQSEMVRALTDSRWTHMGVVFNEPTGPVVFEAVSPVRKTPLPTWIAHGRDRHYVVKRLRM